MKSSFMKRTIVQLAAVVCIIGFVHADETVRSVQQSLKDQGLYYGNITGDKSAETSAAIRRYQIRSGLKVTGEVDPETLGALNISSGSASSQSGSKSTVAQSNNVRPDQSPRIDQNSSPQSFTESDRQPEPNRALPGAPNQPVSHPINKRMAYAEVQRQLISRGYYRGHIDGKYGRQTAFALRAFQSGAGLPPTGHLDMSTLNALGLSNQNLAYLEPARRSSEVWVPITKFKHGKWKMKWKKYHRENGNEYGGDRDLNEDIGWNRDDNNY
jgi:peptidoglycan hydrolase-like protein with peptidoglycan-binding domain